MDGLPKVDCGSVTRTGWYWFVPDERSPEGYVRNLGPVIVYANSNGYPESTTFACSRYYSADHIAHRCGGSFHGPLPPPT